MLKPTLIFRNGDGWEEGYYEYDYEAEGWYQDEYGEWHQARRTVGFERAEKL